MPPHGSDWLIAETSAADVQIPERLSDEHRLIGQTAAEFCAQEIAPAIGEL